MRTYTIFDLMDLFATLGNSSNRIKNKKKLKLKADSLWKAFDLKFEEFCDHHHSNQHGFMDAIRMTYYFFDKKDGFQENPFSNFMEAPKYISVLYNEFTDRIDLMLWNNAPIEEHRKIIKEMKLFVFTHFCGVVTKTVTSEDLKKYGYDDSEG